MPGRPRSTWAPSSTTSTSNGRSPCPVNGSCRSFPGPPAACPAGRGPRRIPSYGPASLSPSRSATSAARSAARRAAASGSAPMSATQSAGKRPPRAAGAQCGSQRTQPHSSAPSPWAESTTIARSYGLCRAAAWPASQRAQPSAAARGPTTPATPIRRRSRVTGTSRLSGGSGRAASWAGPASGRNSIAAGRSARPTRSRSASGSCMRRSHSRRRGPTAVSSTSAGSGAAARRSASSARTAAATRSSKAAIRSRYSRSACRYRFRPYRRSLAHCPIAMSGEAAAKSRKYHCRKTSAVTTPSTAGRNVARSCSRAPSGRPGSAGTTIRRSPAGRASRGGRW